MVVLYFSLFDKTWLQRLVIYWVKGQTLEAIYLSSSSFLNLSAVFVLWNCLALLTNIYSLHYYSVLCCIMLRDSGKQTRYSTQDDSLITSSTLSISSTSSSLSPDTTVTRDVRQRKQCMYRNSESYILKILRNIEVSCSSDMNLLNINIHFISPITPFHWSIIQIEIRAFWRQTLFLWLS